MPEKKTIQRARKAKRQGKAPSTQAGEFVREEMHHVKEGKHGARSRKQVVAIGLSKARRAGVKLKRPSKSRTSAATRKRAERDTARGSRSSRTTRSATKRSRSTKRGTRRQTRNRQSNRRRSS